MPANMLSQGVRAGRLDRADYAANFADLHAPLDRHQAQAAADRCYFCHDAPCVAACPTGIDIPLFIRQIATGATEAAAKTIFDSNILGGMCARVCPTETLCQGACVREAAEGKPVEIGRLQRRATDMLMARNIHPYARAPETGRRVAVVGAGPAGLACAHRLAMAGHEVTVFEARPKPGGLNEYGIAAYKAVEDFAQREVAWLLRIGGIRIEHGKALGRDVSLASLRESHDAVFLGVGLGAVRKLGIEGEQLDGVRDAIDFIAELRQADPSAVAIGRNVVVIGGGMTAVDAAVQAKALGAHTVHLVYRGPKSRMKASLYEQDLAASRGVSILTEATPSALLGAERVEAVRFALEGDETVTLPADQVLTAIGQLLDDDALPETENGKIRTDAQGRTSVGGVWAGGDCALGGDDLTVTAVAQGRDAAESIHAALSA